jgi:hypothetical protein
LPEDVQHTRTPLQAKLTAGLSDSVVTTTSCVRASSERICGKGSRLKAEISLVSAVMDDYTKIVQEVAREARGC